jgi:transcriptional regulator with XRE-family HTH domain
VPQETPDRVLDDLGHRIAELRRASGATQQEIAERLGILVADYQRIERGARNCTVRTLVHVARALGVPTRSLFAAPTSTGPRTPGRPSNRPQPEAGRLVNPVPTKRRPSGSRK